MTSGKLWPVSTCMSGNGKRAGPEGLLGQAQQHDRVLAAGEQQHRALELRGDLAHDVDRFGFERVEVGELVRHGSMTILVNNCRYVAKQDTSASTPWEVDRRAPRNLDKRHPVGMIGAAPLVAHRDIDDIAAHGHQIDRR